MRVIVWDDEQWGPMPAIAAEFGAADLTDDVKALYELIVHSMDWGSGFLSVEDCKPIVRLGELLGLPDLPEVRAQVEAWKLMEAKNAAYREIGSNVQIGDMPPTWTLQRIDEYITRVRTLTDEWVEAANSTSPPGVPPLRDGDWELRLPGGTELSDETIAAVRAHFGRHVREEWGNA